MNDIIPSSSVVGNFILGWHYFWSVFSSGSVMFAVGFFLATAVFDLLCSVVTRVIFDGATWIGRR